MRVGVAVARCAKSLSRPTSYSPMGAPAIHSTYYDHGYTCTEDVPGPLRCGRIAFTCQTPACPNDGNHFIYGECKKHKVKKGNPNALNDHKKLTPSVQCSKTHPFTHQLTGQTQVFRCIITRRYECDDPITAHQLHHFNPNPQPGESRVYPPGYATEQVTSTPETSESPSLVVCTISGCQDSTPYDPTSSSGGWHAPCNECSQYRCKGGGHSWQTSCTDTAHTNANGDSCTVAGYECVSHTPVYPAPPPPTATCSQCSGSYDPNGVHAWKHQPRTCVKAKWVRLSESSVEYRTCTNTFYRCTNGNSTCQTGDIWCIDANGVI